MLGGGWRGYHRAANSRKNLYQNMRNQGNRELVIDRWRRLIYKSMQEFGAFTPNLFGEPDLIR